MYWTKLWMFDLGIGFFVLKPIKIFVLFNTKPILVEEFMLFNS